MNNSEIVSTVHSMKKFKKFFQCSYTIAEIVQAPRNFLQQFLGQTKVPRFITTVKREDEYLGKTIQTLFGVN